MKKHIKTVVTHFKGKCVEWDVVNEGLFDLLPGPSLGFKTKSFFKPALNGTDYKNNIFLRIIGEDYIPIAFKAAAEADPNLKLVYNDNNTDRPEQVRVEGVKKIIELIRSKGGRIDMVGRQAHIGAPGPTKEDQMKTMKMWTDMGVDVVITELDIGMRAVDGDGKPITLKQAAVDKQIESYRRATEACVDTPRCKGVTLWVHTDKVSSIDDLQDLISR